MVWIDILLTILLSFNFGSFFDGIFLTKHKKGSHLTYIGIVFFWFVFFIFNLIINVFIVIYNLIKKNKQKWTKVLKVPNKEHFVSFEYASLFYLIEILTGGLITYFVFLTPLANILDTGNIIFGFLFIVMLISTFSYFFFKALPYSKKRKPFLITSVIILGICLILVSLILLKII